MESAVHSVDLKCLFAKCVFDIKRKKRKQFKSRVNRIYLGSTLLIADISRVNFANNRHNCHKFDIDKFDKQYNRYRFLLSHRS